MRLKILCIYRNKETQFLAQDPDIEFHDHDVTVVHTYMEAQRVVSDPRARFDIILADAWLPDYDVTGEDTMPSMFLMSHIRCGARGFGMFVPEYFENDLTDSLDGRCVLVADKTCWTDTGQRDWVKLLHLVKRMIGEFMV